MSDYTQVVTWCLFFHLSLYSYFRFFFYTFIITQYIFFYYGSVHTFTVGGSESSSEECATQTNGDIQTDWPPVVMIVIDLIDLSCDLKVAVSSIRRKLQQPTVQCFVNHVDIS